MAMVTNPHNVTYKEYIEIAQNDDNHRYEYIDGMVYMMGVPTPLHEMISMKLSANFFNYFTGKPCKPFSGHFGVTLKDENGNENDVIPDLTVVCDTQNLSNTEYTGTPTLVIEIVSPSSISRDYVIKTNLYMMAGIKEYIIIDPKGKQAIYYLFEDKNIKIIQVYKEIETIQSQIFEGLQINLRDIFEDILDIEEYEKSQATIKLLSKLMKAEKAIKTGDEWLTEEQIKLWKA